MQGTLESALGFLACPKCKGPLRVEREICHCIARECGLAFPVIRDTPILIVEERSVFRMADYKSSESMSLGYKPRRSIVSFLYSWIPSVTENRVGERQYTKLLWHLRQFSGSKPRQVLIVGAGDAGAGIGTLRSAPDILVLETDVYFDGSVAVIADGHDLPFLDGSFDAVVLQAVLEHVADPARCVAEAHRVLRDDGLVYAESPFMYPVHLGAYDFFRFSLIGHRRLFRQFRQLGAGVVAGAGTALALAFKSFALSLSAAKTYQSLVRLCVPFLVFWLKYLDRYTATKPHASDFACTTYFLGRKALVAMTDAEVIASYRRPS